MSFGPINANMIRQAMQQAQGQGLVPTNRPNAGLLGRGGLARRPMNRMAPAVVQPKPAAPVAPPVVGRAPEIAIPAPGQTMQVGGSGFAALNPHVSNGMTPAQNQAAFQDAMAKQQSQMTEYQNRLGAMQTDTSAMDAYNRAKSVEAMGGPAAGPAPTPAVDPRRAQMMQQYQQYAGPGLFGGLGQQMSGMGPQMSTAVQPMQGAMQPIGGQNAGMFGNLMQALQQFFGQRGGF